MYIFAIPDLPRGHLVYLHHFLSLLLQGLDGGGQHRPQVLKLQERRTLIKIISDVKRRQFPGRTSIPMSQSVGWYLNSSNPWNTKVTGHCDFFKLRFYYWRYYRCSRFTHPFASLYPAPPPYPWGLHLFTCLNVIGQTWPYFTLCLLYTNFFNALLCLEIQSKNKPLNQNYY